MMRIVDDNERVAIAERAYSLYLTESKTRGLDLPSSDVFTGAVQQAQKSTYVEPPVSHRIPDPDGFRVKVLEDRVARLESQIAKMEDGFDYHTKKV